MERFGETWSAAGAARWRLVIPAAGEETCQETLVAPPVLCIGAGDPEATSYTVQQTVQSSVQVICTPALLCTGAGGSEATSYTVQQTVQSSVQVIDTPVFMHWCWF